MTDHLQDLFTHRAERAVATAHARLGLADLAEARIRSRRNRLTLASGAAVVAAAATVGLAVVGTGSQPGPRRPDVVGVAPSAAGSPTAAQHKVVRRQGTATLVPVGTGGTTDVLVAIDPAPERAEISLGLVPDRFVYLSDSDAETFYGPAGTTAGEYFSNGLVVDVHESMGDATEYPLTVDGRPASYGTSDGYTTVRVRWSPQVDVGFQAPPSAHLTEAQALQMAAALDVRSTTQLTHG